jgi:hypothetical protein
VGSEASNFLLGESSKVLYVGVLPVVCIVETFHQSIDRQWTFFMIIYQMTYCLHNYNVCFIGIKKRKENYMLIYKLIKHKHTVLSNMMRILA